MSLYDASEETGTPATPSASRQVLYPKSSGWYRKDSAGTERRIIVTDASDKIPLTDLPAAIAGAMNYQGGWNATTNTPTLASGVGTKGYYYVVTVAGTTNLDGHNVWTIGDIAVFNGTTWDIIQGGITSTEIITALGYTPENVSNKSTDGTLAANSLTLYPSQSAVKTYADNKLAKAPNVYTIGPSNCDYTSIQAALNAHAVANALFLVYPGTYTDTINFTANGQCVVGLGTSSQQVVTQVSTDVCNGSTFTNCHIENLTLTVSAATSSVGCITLSTGSLLVTECFLFCTNSTTTTASQPYISNVTSTGTLEIEEGEQIYTNTISDGTGITAIKAVHIVGTGGTSVIESTDITVNGGGLSLGITPFYSPSTGTFIPRHNDITVTDTVATLVVGYFSAGSGALSELDNNVIHMAGGGTSSVVAVYLTGTATLTSHFNHYQCLGGLTNYAANLAAGSVLNSYYDAIQASSGKTGTGTFNTEVHNAINKTTPVGADEIGIWDSVSQILNKVSFTNLLNWFAAKNGNSGNNFAASALTVTTINGLTPTANATGFSIAGGTVSKTLTINNSIGISGTDGTIMTFPSTSATIARTDAANTFTGVQTFNDAISVKAGTAGAPSIYLDVDTTTGFYRGGANTISASVSGANIFSLVSTGLSIFGSINEIKSQNADTANTVTNTSVTSASKASMYCVSDIVTTLFTSYSSVHTDIRYGFALAGCSEIRSASTNGLVIGTGASNKPVIIGSNGAEVSRHTSTGVAVTGAVSATTTLKSGGYLVATLPVGTTGERAYVTDATAPTWLGALTGGGTVVCPVFKNATIWVSA